MTGEELSKRDAEFFKAFAKDKTINRKKFNAEYALKHQKVKEVYKCGFDIPAPTPEHAKIYAVLKQYCDKFPGVSKPNLVLSGATGTGKTFTANIIAKNLAKRGIDVQFVTAFSMVNMFQRFVNSFGKEIEAIDALLECDVLVVDDIGSEPIIKNVTQEYIYNVINERLVNNRAFIITTNLCPAALIERYDQRIASRILAKESSTIIEFKGKDLRIK
jgi:DNA replication protein DnaC